MNALLQTRKELALDEAAQAEPVRRSEHDTHPIVESDTDDATVDAPVPKRSVNPNCVPNPFDPSLLVTTPLVDDIQISQFVACGVRLG